MSSLPFSSYPKVKRRYLPGDLNPGSWPEIEKRFEVLESEVGQAITPEALEEWLMHWSELQAAIDEEGARRYIAMTLQTEDTAAEQAYLAFVEQVEPKVKPRLFALCKLYLAHPQRIGLPKERYEVFDRDVQRTVELFREENIPLETEEAKLGQQYQKLTGGLTVQFREQEKTLPQMGIYLENPDRATRREAWELVANRRLREADAIEGLFDQLLELRFQIAKNAGFDDFVSFAFRSLGRFDYTPEDCFRFHNSVEETVMPIVEDLLEQRRRRLKVETVKPWDLAVDPLGRPGLKPFQAIEELETRAQEVFDRLDAELADGYALMRRWKALDLENRKGKAPGGYQSTLAESRAPFIFMNAVGVQRDVETLLHEAGHAFHTLATRSQDFYPYRNAPIEFCEVASMSMELIGSEQLERFYSPDDAQRARHDHLEGVIKILPWIATIDAFQHWIYSHPGHSRTDRRQAWLELMDRFGGSVDWSGNEEGRANLWHKQIHLFLHPFYYIEYGIAQLGALQVWARFKKDRPAALQAYKRALKLGGARPLPELFEAAGCRFDFGPDTVRPLMEEVRAQL